MEEKCSTIKTVVKDITAEKLGNNKKRRKKNGLKILTCGIEAFVKENQYKFMKHHENTTK